MSAHSRGTVPDVDSRSTANEGYKKGTRSSASDDRQTQIQKSAVGSWGGWFVFCSNI